MILASLVSILFSGALLFVLGGRDPKRLRNLVHAAHGVHTNNVTPLLSPSLRRTLGWLTLAPGVVLVLLGQWWALFIWLGVICALGWLTSHLLAS